MTDGFVTLRHQLVISTPTRDQPLLDATFKDMNAAFRQIAKESDRPPRQAIGDPNESMRQIVNESDTSS
jgi:hypothetical protein